MLWILEKVESGYGWIWYKKYKERAEKTYNSGTLFPIWEEDWNVKEYTTGIIIIRNINDNEKCC